MVFNSVAFGCFLPVVLLGYWLLRSRARQNAWLLVASYVFYAAFDWRFLGLMVGTTLVDHAVGRRLAALDGDGPRRRRLFAVSVASNLGVLATFKYLGFFSASAASLLHRLGVHADLPTLHVLLPIGISFYTFHGISYTCDVYRRRIEPASSLLTFACFVAYFPQLVAGPIGRAELQLPQFERERVAPDAEAVWSAGVLVLVGFVKKVAVADTLAPLVSHVFDHPQRQSGATVLLALVAFSLQIYGDFSGYTDIARGVSRLFGIELPVNFAQPYGSRSITEYWRRWHISLSSWLRDYLYVPLGGSRRGPRRTYVNLLVTMVLGGLWHGAAWTFVLWGALHGVALAAHRWWCARRPGVPVEAPFLLSRDWWRVGLTLGVVLVGWVLFRARTLGDSEALLRDLLRPGPVDGAALVTVLVALVAVVVIDVVQRVGLGALLERLRVPALRPAVRGAALGAAGCALLVTVGGPPVQFIYFQF